MRHIYAVSVIMLLVAASGVCALQKSSKYRRFEVRIRKEVLATEVMGSKLFRLPQLRVYNRKGEQVGDLEDGVSESFKDKLEAVLKSPSTLKRDKTLKWELERVDGIDAQHLPDADVTIVQYWAEWCKPCKAQAEVVNQVVSTHPELEVNILHVEADPTKAFPEQFRRPTVNH